MKIIDLLNKIANGEEVPKKVKYLNQVFELTNNKVDWYCYDYNINLLGNEIGLQQLNDTIEIIEEPRDIEVCGSLFTKSEYDKLAHSEEEKKIPEKLDYIHPDISCSYNESELLLRIEANKDKINEIIEYLKSKGDE